MTILRELRTRTGDWHRPSVWVAAGFGVLSVLCVVAMLVDRRTLLDAPIWAKPFKFAISGALYFFTWAWLVSLVSKFQRTTRWITNLVIAIFSSEYVVLTFQAARGRPSHFANGTPFDAGLYVLMGYMISGLLVATLALTVLVMFSRVADRATWWGVRLGAVVSVIGLSLGTLMTSPTALQLARQESGGTLDLVGGHNVGLDDGGPGLPILGWSTVGGDLRIPHFIGMHALQALPLLALALGLLAARFPKLRDAAVRTRLVILGAVGYAGLVGLVTWQALRAQSIVHPDATTAAAFAGLVAAMALGAFASVRVPARDREAVR